MKKGHFIVSELVSPDEVKRVSEFDLKFDIHKHNLFSDMTPDIEPFENLSNLIDDDEISKMVEELKEVSASMSNLQAVQIDIDRKILNKVAKSLDFQLSTPKIIFVIYQGEEYFLGTFHYSEVLEMEGFLYSLVHLLAQRMVE